MSKHSVLAAAAATVLLAACSTNDPYARSHSFGARYEHYRPSVVELARMRTGDVFDYEVSDVDFVNYTDHVKAILRSKFTNARFARYTSATGQVLLGGLAGAAAAFDAGATTVATLALSSAALPQVGGIFNAKARAETYQDAVRLIEEAEIDYLSEVGSPSSRELTANGVDLYRRVTTTLNIVEKAIVGQLPTLQEMKDVSGESTRTARRPKKVIKVLSGRTAATTTATSTTVFTRRSNESVRLGTPSLDDEPPSAPPVKRPKVKIKAGTPSLDDEPGSASAGRANAGEKSSDRTGEKRSDVKIKQGVVPMDGGSQKTESSTEGTTKRSDADIKAGTESLDSNSEAKKRSNAKIKEGTGSLDDTKPGGNERRGDAKIKEGTKSLNGDASNSLPR